MMNQKLDIKNIIEENKKLKIKIANLESEMDKLKLETDEVCEFVYNEIVIGLRDFIKSMYDIDKKLFYEMKESFIKFFPNKKEKKINLENNVDK